MIGKPRASRNDPQYVVYDVPFTVHIAAPDVDLVITERYEIGLHYEEAEQHWFGSVVSRDGVGVVWCDTIATGATPETVVIEILNRLTLGIKPEFQKQNEDDE